jgi:poly-gamma-glutamate capsule biosynthesis protein CapA/YwtB (metallophosphatase superfamily)
MKILLVGDVMLGRLVNEVLKTKPLKFPWGDTLPIFTKADYRLCNLECVISDIGRPWSKPAKLFHFRSDSKNIQVLKAANIDAVSLANNHALDFEYDALFQMLYLLSQNGISRAGAGKDLSEAAGLSICEIVGTKIGLISFTDNEPVWEATKDKPGIFYVPIKLEDPRAQNLLEIVNQAKKKIDFLIVSAHWGPNWGHYPPDDHQAFARALIDAGVDIIYGHSPHIFRGIEIYNQRPILYSTGNFIDDYAVDEVERNDQSFIFIIETKGKEVSGLKIYPTVIRNFQALKAKTPEAEEIMNKMVQLCSELGTQAVWKPKEDCLEIKII